MINISLIVPCYNEYNRLPVTLKKIEDWLSIQKTFIVELVLANDGSEDKTIILLNNIKKRFEDKKICTVKVFDFEHRGYIETLFDCYKKSTNNILCNMEADCSIHPKNFEYFSNFLDEFDMIQGSRILKQKNSKSFQNKGIIRSFLSIFYSYIFRFLFKSNILDPQCGFKMIKKEKLIYCLKNIKLSHDGLKVTELTLRFHQNNFKIKEIPILNQHNEDSRLIPNFSFLKPFPFLKVIMSNLLAIIELYYILKKENLDR